MHARGADIAILLAAVATIVAFLRLRPRRDLWVGSLVFTVLLVAVIILTAGLMILPALTLGPIVEALQ